MELTTPFLFYIIGYCLASFVALLLLVANRKEIILCNKAYWNYLLQPWKLITFLIALSAFIFLAPYTGDPTWDYIDASFMSILTYITAPWAIGTIYKAIRNKTKWTYLYIAVCAWMFSASWSYDLYILWRDNFYPLTWFSNIFASSVLYVSAGLMWNLVYKEGRGVIFGFMLDTWPEREPDDRFNKILIYALPFMIFAAAIFVPFLF